jgi:hypothetical protein
MTREEYIKLFHKEQLNLVAFKRLLDCDEEVLRLVNRVIQTEREAVANWLMRKGFATGHGDTIVDMLDELEWQVAEREREACAKIADKSHRIFRDTKDAHDRNSPNLEPFNLNAFGFSVDAIEESLRITSAIRARGQE